MQANKAADAASEQAHAAYEGMQGSFAMAAEAAEKTKTEEPASEEVSRVIRRTMIKRWATKLDDDKKMRSRISFTRWMT